MSSYRRVRAVTTGSSDVAAILRALDDAGVLFVVVGDPAVGQPLRLVVSAHPTNLEVLGRALDGLGAVLRVTPGAGEAGREAPTGAAGGPRRVGDPMGTVELTTRAGEVDLLFGGPRRALYAEVTGAADVREVCGVVVRWTARLPLAEPPPRAPNRTHGRRLLSVAEGLAQLMERRPEPERPPEPGPTTEREG